MSENDPRNPFFAELYCKIIDEGKYSEAVYDAVERYYEGIDEYWLDDAHRDYTLEVALDWVRYIDKHRRVPSDQMAQDLLNALEGTNGH